MLRSSAFIAEEALRQVSALSPLDTAATPEEFDIALTRLALVIDELIETEQLQFFRPQSQTIQLEANRSAPYDLDGLLDIDLIFITAVYLVFPNGKERLIRQLRRDIFESETDDPARTGLPTICYIENNNAPTIELWPTITEEGYSLRLSGYRASEDVTQSSGKTAHGFTPGWQLALIYMLAVDLGSGPITNIQQSKLDRLERKGAQKLRRLQARQNKEQRPRPSVTKPRIF